MPQPDHALIFGCTVAAERLAPTTRAVVIAIVDVRSDKLVLDAEDQERHVYGGVVRSVGYTLEGSEAFDTLAEACHQLQDVNAGRESLFNQPADETPARYVEGDDSVKLPAVYVNGVRQHVKSSDLAALELAPARFMSAVAALKMGSTLADATIGWTTEQADFLSSFMPKPKRTKRTDTPQETQP